VPGLAAFYLLTRKERARWLMATRRKVIRGARL
jgi:hypothetical protein